MYAHSINVGQGACNLLEFPCGCVLIDTGAQSDQHVSHLVDYLRAFFAKRTDLQNTIDLVIISHPHKDHTWGLKEVGTTFNVRNYIDNGVFDRGSGKAEIKWFRQQVAAGMLHTTVRAVDDAEIAALPERNGLTDEVIDPIHCADCDPQIRVLSGRIERRDRTDWSRQEFDNWNNHSLVVRIDFGEASFLFTGDLEEPAIRTLLSYY